MTTKTERRFRGTHAQFEARVSHLVETIISVANLEGHVVADTQRVAFTALVEVLAHLIANAPDRSSRDELVHGVMTGLPGLVSEKAERYDAKRNNNE